MEGLNLSTKKIISILLLEQQNLLLNLIKKGQYQIIKQTEEEVLDEENLSREGGIFFTTIFLTKLFFVMIKIHPGLIMKLEEY